MYVALAEDYYEVADTFPTGDNIDGLYDWIGLWTYKNLASAVDSKKVYGNLVPVLGTNIHEVKRESDYLLGTDETDYLFGTNVDDESLHEIERETDYFSGTDETDYLFGTTP